MPVRRKGSITGWVLGKLLFRMDSGTGIPLVEDTEDTGSDIVADDSFIVFADNANAKFPIVCACCV